MGMDKNTVIGFVLIGALLIAMFVINSRSNQAYLTEKKRVEDSIAATRPQVDPVAAQKDSLIMDFRQWLKGFSQDRLCSCATRNSGKIMNNFKIFFT